MKGSDRREMVKMDHMPIVKPWRDELTPEELRLVENARQYTEFWAGVPNSNLLIFVDKLVRLLDGERNG